MKYAFLSGLIALGLAAPAVAQMPSPLPPEALVEAVDPAKVDYLRAHVVGSGAVTAPLTLRLPKAFYGARLILLGESHGSAAPQALDLQLLTELNRRVGLRDYVAEVDVVQAERLNRYLVTGDEADLDRVFDFWTDSAQWGNTLFEDKIRRIRALNQTLPANRGIRFWGLDAIQDWPLLVDWLTAAGASPDTAALAATKTEKGKAQLALTWLDAATGGDPETREALRVGLTQRASGAGREGTIFANYAAIVRSGALGARPAYGLWGMFHVLKAPVNKAPPFATRVMASDLPTAKAVFTLGLLPLDSAMVIPAPMPGGVKMLRMTQFNVDGPMVKVQGTSNLRAATAPDTVTLFDLTAAGSPYAKAPDLVATRTTIGQNFTPDDPAAPTTAYIDIVGVIRGSDWAPPRKR